MSSLLMLAMGLAAFVTGYMFYSKYGAVHDMGAVWISARHRGHSPWER